MYTRFVMLRDLERTPVISQDGVVLSKKVQRDIRRLAAKLKARGTTIDKRWRRKAQAIFGKELDPPRLRALAAINPGSWWALLAKGRINDFLEQVEYHGRRLAKLDVAPKRVLASVQESEQALLPELKSLVPTDDPEYYSALDHLYFLVRLKLNDAYYQVRDLEAKAFYEVLQDQLESLSVQDLLHRVLETLMRTFRAQGGVILLKDAESDLPGREGLERARRAAGEMLRNLDRPRPGRAHRAPRQADRSGRRRKRAAHQGPADPQGLPEPVGRAADGARQGHRRARAGLFPGVSLPAARDEAVRGDRRALRAGHRQGAARSKSCTTARSRSARWAST